ncbi:MAG: hypothetical protein PUC57_08100 [Oscillospiraceae bacterium]|nr:hypothetical protein [Oscillospiraceae bacterium]
MDSCRPYYLQFKMKVGKKEFFRVVGEELCRPLDPLELLYPNELPLFEKYDEYVPPELVRKGFARGVLDIDGMRARVREWVQQAAETEPV